MDKEDALRVYERLEVIGRAVTKIETMIEDRQRECDNQQKMVEELRKRITVLEQNQAKGSGGVIVAGWAFGAIMTLVSVGLSLYLATTK